MVLEPPADSQTPDLRLASGGLLNLTAQLVGLVTNFLIGVLVARVLGPAGKGELAVLMQVPAVLLIVFGLGIAAANAYFIANAKVSAGLVLGNTLALALPAAALGVPVALLLLTGPLAVLPGLPWAAIALAALAVPLGLLVAWLTGLSTGMGRLRLNLQASLASSLLTLLAVVAMFVAHVGSLSAVVAFSVAGTASAIVVLLLGLLPSARPLGVSLATLREMTSYSGRSYLGGLAGYLHLRQDVLIIGWLAGAASVGIYSVGVSFAELLWYVPAALSGVILARGARHAEAAALDYVARSSRTSVLAMLLGAGIGVVVVPAVITLIFGRAFILSSWVFFLLVPGALGDGVARVAMTYQMAAGRVYWRQSVAATLSNLVANLVLVPLFGFVGAAVASSLSYMLLAALVLHRLRADTGARVLDFLLPRADDWSIAIQAARETPGRFKRGLGGAEPDREV